MTAADTQIEDFPSTHRTWLVTQIESVAADTGIRSQEALAALREHLFQRYAEPLYAYVRHSSIRRLGEPEDLVHGYFVRMLADCSSLRRWPQSGRHFRKWLLSGLLFHVRGITRDLGRSREFSSLESIALHAAAEPTAEQAYEHAWSRQILQTAYATAAGEMERAGRNQQWMIFRRHVLDGEPYAPLAKEYSVSLQHCADATRDAVQQVRHALRIVLIEEGVAERDATTEADEIFRSVIGGPPR